MYTKCFGGKVSMIPGGKVSWPPSWNHRLLMKKTLKSFIKRMHWGIKIKKKSFGDVERFNLGTDGTFNCATWRTYAVALDWFHTHAVFRIVYCYACTFHVIQMNYNTIEYHSSFYWTLHTESCSCPPGQKTFQHTGGMTYLKTLSQLLLPPIYFV